MALVITASFLFVINYLQSLLSKGIQLKLKDILVISIEKAIKSNNPQDWAMYKRLQKRINRGVKSTKASYYAGAFIQSNGNSRKTCQLINQLTSRKKNNASVKELKLNENSITTEAQALSDPLMITHRGSPNDNIHFPKALVGRKNIVDEFELKTS